MTTRRFRVTALSLFGVSLLGAAPAAADGRQTTPMQPNVTTRIDTCQDDGSYLGTGLHRLGGGQNMLMLQVCGDAAMHSVRKVAATYLKVDGPRAGGLRLHWRWADAAGTVRGGGDDDHGAFSIDPQNQAVVVWAYNHPVTAQDPGARCLVGVLSQGTTQYVTEPVCP